MFDRCPGSRLFAEPIPEPIMCPHCGREVEIFTTEQSMRCCAKYVVESTIS